MSLNIKNIKKQIKENKKMQKFFHPSGFLICVTVLGLRQVVRWKFEIGCGCNRWLVDDLKHEINETNNRFIETNDGSRTLKLANERIRLMKTKRKANAKFSKPTN